MALPEKALFAKFGKEKDTTSRKAEKKEKVDKPVKKEKTYSKKDIEALAAKEQALQETLKEEKKQAEKVRDRINKIYQKDTSKLTALEKKHLVKIYGAKNYEQAIEQMKAQAQKSGTKFNEAKAWEMSPLKEWRMELGANSMKAEKLRRADEQAAENPPKGILGRLKAWANKPVISSTFENTEENRAKVRSQGAAEKAKQAEKAAKGSLMDRWKNFWAPHEYVFPDKPAKPTAKDAQMKEDLNKKTKKSAKEKAA